jgi:hypothetical protein
MTITAGPLLTTTGAALSFCRKEACSLTRCLLLLLAEWGIRQDKLASGHR